MVADDAESTGQSGSRGGRSVVKRKILTNDIAELEKRVHLAELHAREAEAEVRYLEAAAKRKALRTGAKRPKIGKRKKTLAPQE